MKPPNPIKSLEFNRLVGERIRIARKDIGLSQSDLSKQLGFNKHQILSNIEAGRRKVSFMEMINISQILNKPLSYFTDPYL